MSRTVHGARVLVTGATRGMGRLFAERAAAEGAAAVVLWGRDRAALDRVAVGLARPGLTVRTDVVDLTDHAALDDAARAVLARDGAPDVLINNAGTITSNRYFWELDPRAVEDTLLVNTLAPMRLVSRLLPAMIDDDGRAKRILNVASAAGIVPNPRMSVYAASKAAAMTWSDTLRLELEQAGHDHVSVTTFCPSYVSTGMFAGAGGVLATPTLRPEVAVDRAWRAMLTGRPLVITPAAVHLARAARGVLPARAWDRLARTFGVHRSMDHFTGRS